MIPQRLKLSGFLSYKDEQEIFFEAAPLWMLTGANGSGKSTIFDALTFALFGCHRGGSTNYGELINRSSTALAVEFDFLLDKQHYRVKRTVKPGKNSPKSTIQAFLQDGEGSWKSVPDTDQRAKFDLWMRNTIGLDYETFTASVLLLQGKAEKLLDSTPAGRAGVLARIVDLERYQKLHAKVDEKRREAKAQLEGVENQLAGLRQVSDDESMAAATRIAEAEAVRNQTQRRLDLLGSLELQALRWADSQDRLAASRDKLKHAESLLGHAVAIEKEHARLRELRDVIPAVNVIVTERNRIAESRRATEKLEKERQAMADSLRSTQHASEQARDKTRAHKKTQSEDEARQTLLNKELRELAGVLEKVKLVEETEAESLRSEAELKRFPTDLNERILRHEEDVSRLSILSQAFPLLERICSERSDLLQARRRETASQQEADRLRGEGETAKANHERLLSELESAKGARERAAAAAAEARALLQQARKLAESFKKLSGEKNCTVCGQVLTEEHYQEEKDRRDQHAQAAEQQFQELASREASCRESEAALSAQEAEARKQLESLRERFKDQAGEARAASTEAARLTASCKKSYLALPDDFKEKVSPSLPADWSQITYPHRDELPTLRAQASGLDEARRKLRETTEAANGLRIHQSKCDSARERLARLKQDLPAGDHATLRQTQHAKQADDIALANSLKALKKEIELAEREAERLQTSLSAVERNQVEITGKLNLEESTRKQSEEAIERAKKTLPPAWQGPLEHAGFAERGKWQDELDSLVAKGTESQFTQLQAARGGLESHRAEILLLEEEADAFPEEARRSPEEVKGELAAEREELDRRNTELLDAQREQGILEEFRRQRAELSEKFLALDRSHRQFEQLAKLLGRDRLQRHLVRKAERQIIDCANVVLDRLSGGMLFLKLVGDESTSGTEKALELECHNRVTGGAPINVAFLSGSQRFRVAVALALGIGQYASKQFRPIESVIIDEGFGCLDRSGRQVMIQELQNLRGHLKSILLVSHQEEFADAFPDSYRFELVDGATRVARIQK